LLGDGDKNSLFEGLSIGETGLGIKKNLTAGYCGRNGGLEMGVLAVADYLVEGETVFRWDETEK